MPQILIFDDDSKKCALASEVAKAMDATSANQAKWVLAFGEQMKDLKSAKRFMAALDSADDPLILLDIEIIGDNKAKDWRVSATSAISNKVPRDSRSYLKSDIDKLERCYGTHAHYQLSLSLLAYARLHGIGVITISTKSNISGEHNLLCAQNAGVPFISSWSEDWERLNKPQERISQLASSIADEWVKRRGSLEQRLWPREALDKEWFSASPQGGNVPIQHAFILELTAKAPYRERISQYLAAVSGINTLSFKAHEANDAAVLERRHDALKCIVGADAKAHSGRNRLPSLNTVALLAAAWDPDAAKWFPQFGWDATCQMMPDKTTQQALKDVILAIGGEDGLFPHLLRNKPNTTKGTLKKVEAGHEMLKLNMGFPLNNDSRGGTNGMMQKFLSASSNNKSEKNAAGGDTSERLISVWKKLGASGKRMIDIEVTPEAIVFKSHKIRS